MNDEANFIEEFMMSSSSSSSTNSSSDEGTVLANFINKYTEKKKRVENFIEAVIDKYSEIEFKENLRISRKMFEFLVEEFKKSHHCKENNTRGKPAVPAKAQILIFLWFAGNKSSYREVCNLFDIALSTMHSHLNDVLEFFFEISPNYIKFPRNVDEKLSASNEFEKISGFKNILGCVDGCYIYIRKPANKLRSTYTNRHDLLSITLQGICDARKKFIDVFTGSPSKIHDSRILKLSFISDELPTICSNRYHLLGDAAYPLREYLLTPFKDFGNLTARQRQYNLRHCQTRVKIENAFGLLKQRFRQLMRLEFFQVETMSKFILACCVLHNLCIDNDCHLIGELSNEETSSSSESGTTNIDNNNDSALKRLGEIKRNMIMNEL